MIVTEWLPYALSIGIDENRFWSLNPRLIKPYIKAYRIRKQEENSMMYVQGRYILDALMCSVGNMFKKKNTKPFEYPQKPYELFTEQIELTEEEVKRQRENLMLSLKIMMGNFNRSHNKGDNGS